MNQLRKKVGPLPLYAWIIGGVVGLYLLTRGSAASAAAPMASTNPAAAASGGDAGSGGAGISIPQIGSFGYGDTGAQMAAGNFLSGLGDVGLSTDVGGSYYSPPQQGYQAPIGTGLTNSQLPSYLQVPGLAPNASVISSTMGGASGISSVPGAYSWGSTGKQ